MVYCDISFITDSIIHRSTDSFHPQTTKIIRDFFGNKPLYAALRSINLPSFASVLLNRFRSTFVFQIFSIAKQNESCEGHKVFFSRINLSGNKMLTHREKAKPCVHTIKIWKLNKIKKDKVIFKRVGDPSAEINAQLNRI